MQERRRRGVPQRRECQCAATSLVLPMVTGKRTGHKRDSPWRLGRQRGPARTPISDLWLPEQ